MLLWRPLSATLLAAGVKALAGRGMPAVAEAEPVATQAVVKAHAETKERRHKIEPN